jgi:hypothetical protein
LYILAKMAAFKVLSKIPYGTECLGRRSEFSFQQDSANTGRLVDKSIGYTVSLVVFLHFVADNDTLYVTHAYGVYSCHPCYPRIYTAPSDLPSHIFTQILPLVFPEYAKIVPDTESGNIARKHFCVEQATALSSVFPYAVAQNIARFNCDSGVDLFATYGVAYGPLPECRWEATKYREKIYDDFFQALSLMPATVA